MRTLVIGDVHGKLGLLKQSLERAEMVVEDQLVFLGDYVDGGGEDFDPRALIDYILELSNEKILLMGNHDWWCYEWLNGSGAPGIWTSQGGQATIESFASKKVSAQAPLEEIFHATDIQKYKEFFDSLVKSHEDDEARYIHGGWNYPFEDFDTVEMQSAIWDRELIQHGWVNYDGKKVFIGHSTVQMFEDTDQPLFRNQVIDIDTGAGHGKKLTIMNRDTLEYWQSDESGFGRF